MAIRVRRAVAAVTVAAGGVLLVAAPAVGQEPADPAPDPELPGAELISEVLAG